jgi:hypothetical protein
MNLTSFSATVTPCIHSVADNLYVAFDILHLGVTVLSTPLVLSPTLIGLSKNLLDVFF